MDSDKNELIPSNYKNYISVTDLSSYLYCPRKLFLTKVYKIRPKPTRVAGVGTLAHQLVKVIADNYDNVIMLIKEGDDLDTIRKKLFSFFKDVEERLVKEIIDVNSGDFKDITSISDSEKELLDSVVFNETLFFSDVIFKFVSKNHVYGNQLRETIVPKIYSEVDVSSEDFLMRGRIDRVLDFRNFKVVIEYKSGERPQRIWESQKIQLGSYILMTQKDDYKRFIKQKFQGKETEKIESPFRGGFLIYLRDYSRIKIQLDNLLENKILQLRDDVNSLIKSKKLPPRVTNVNKCKNCNFREYCMKLPN
ncbi:MAG: Dna2/Cas4 domain-containing protein [Nitrospiraceae bacterium]|nr:Dna2/Cas4 domain-containing protein [Nitrospiraceae bacterium]